MHVSVCLSTCLENFVALHDVVVVDCMYVGRHHDSGNVLLFQVNQYRQTGSCIIYNFQYVTDNPLESNYT